MHVMTAADADNDNLELTGQLIVTRSIRIPRSELQFRFVRSSGPGGQNVNKVNTKACLRWNVAESPSLTEAVRQRFTKKYRRRITQDGELVMTSQRYRDQGRNVQDCLDKLTELVRTVAIVPKPRKKTKPSRASKERRLKSKRERSGRKQTRRPPRTDD
jgi:ribosome-associated protein